MQIYLKFGPNLLLLLGAYYSLHLPQQVIAKSPIIGGRRSNPKDEIATPFGLAMTTFEYVKCKLFHALLNKTNIIDLRVQTFVRKGKAQ